MTVRMLLGAIGIFSLVYVPCAPAQPPSDGCRYPVGGGQLVVERTSDGLAVRFSKPEESRTALIVNGYREFAERLEMPPGRTFPHQAVERLGIEAGAVVLYSGGQRGLESSKPLPIHGVWRGPDPLSCLQSFAQAAGFEVVVPAPGVWVVGPREEVEKAGLLVFAYPLDITLQPLQSEVAVGDVERALLRDLRVRDVSRVDLVGLGYWWVPGEPDTLLVVATRGANTNPSDGNEISVKALKVQIRREGGRIQTQCLWSRYVPGPLLPAVQEDFDGDGTLDFYFQEAGDRDLLDVLVSGADGSKLAEVGGRSVAVQKTSAGRPLFAVETLFVGGEKLDGRVFQYSTEAEAIQRAEPSVATLGASAQSQRPYRHRSDLPGEMLAETLNAGEGVKLYALPGFDTPMLVGAEYVRVHSSSVWGWFVDRNVHSTIAGIPKDLAVHPLLRFTSAGYLQEREKQNGQVKD